jgi:DNA-binding transcriptional regulator YdaS (Cro superfamily)
MPSQHAKAMAMKQQQRDPVLDMVRNVRGTAPRIAAACGVIRSAVWNWKRVPAQHVLTVEELLEIPRHRIRPDIYPPPSHPATKRWLNSNGRRQHGGSART